jgi:hypothetical protein
MSKLHLNAIATRALVDREFQVKLLNGQRKEMLGEFTLSEEEMKLLLLIKEDSLDQFIGQLGKLIQVSLFFYQSTSDRLMVNTLQPLE